MLAELMTMWLWKPTIIEQKIRVVAYEESYDHPEYLIKLAKCESSLRPEMINDNGIYGLDRGLFQWNDKYHPEISNECAFSPECATKETIKLIKKGRGKEWRCSYLIAKGIWKE